MLSMPNLVRIQDVEDNSQNDVDRNTIVSDVDADAIPSDTSIDTESFLDEVKDVDQTSALDKDQPSLSDVDSISMQDMDMGIEPSNLDSSVEINPSDSNLDNLDNGIQQDPMSNLSQSDFSQSVDSQSIDPTLVDSTVSDMEQNIAQEIPVADDPSIDQSTMPLEGNLEITNPDRKDLDAATKDDAMAREMTQPSLDTTVSEPSDIDELNFEKEFDSDFIPDIDAESDAESNGSNDFAQDSNEQNSEDTVNDLQDMLSDYLDLSGEGMVSGEDIANSLSDAVDNGTFSQSDASSFVQDVAHSALDGNEAASDLLETIGSQADNIFDNGLNDFADSLDNSALSAQGAEDVIGKLADNMSNLESDQASFGNVHVSADENGKAQIDNPDEVSNSSQVANDSAPDTDAVSNDTQLNQVTSELADNPDIAQNYLDGDGQVDLDALQDTVTNLVDNDPSLTNVDDGTLNTDAIQDAIESQQLANDVATGVEANIPQYDNATNDQNENPIDQNNPWNNVDQSNLQDSNNNDLDTNNWNDLDADDDWHDFAVGE